jgi:hypothetical protein
VYQHRRAHGGSRDSRGTGVLCNTGGHTGGSKRHQGGRRGITGGSERAIRPPEAGRTQQPTTNNSGEDEGIGIGIGGRNLI